MVQIGGKVDIRPVMRSYDDLDIAIARNQRLILPVIGDLINSAVKRGHWFDKDSNRLKGSLFVAKVKSTKTQSSIDVGWSGKPAIYGPILENGPKKKSWIIKPVGRKADGKPVTALRWVGQGGKIVYRKNVQRNWTTRSLRPHYSEVLNKERKNIKALIDDANKRAIKAAGLSPI